MACHALKIKEKGEVEVAQEYKIIYRGASAELVEKKSRFLAHVEPAGSEEEALAFVKGVRKKYWDGGHHCFAYIIGERGQTARSGDDGEPSGTAGKPMLEVLAGEGLHDVCAVVTRYFGGTLLGTGGLVRAYQEAVKAGLKKCAVMEKKPGLRLEVTTDYCGSEKVRRLAARSGVHTLDVRYTDQVVFLLLVPAAEEGRICSLITEGTSGQAHIKKLEEVYYGLGEGNIIVF